MNFNNQEFNQFRKDLEEATKELAEKYGVSIHAGKISYNDLSFDIKVTVTKAEEGLNVEQEQFNRLCGYYGLVPEDYLRRVTISGREFELYGLNPKAKKDLCEIRDVKTKQLYKCSMAVFRKACGEGHGHECKYCGQWVDTDDNDELCDRCKEAFGHTHYSEL